MAQPNVANKFVTEQVNHTGLEENNKANEKQNFT